MTEEQIKAKLSQHVVELLASRRGYKCAKPDQDHGVDLTVSHAVPIERNGRTRYLDSGRYLDIQLKSTCEKQIERTGNMIRYKIEAKTWNDLVFRRTSGALAPLFLVLLVLPDDADQWVSVSPDEVIIRRAAYWYRPGIDAEPTENTSTLTIAIPEANSLTLSFIEDRFGEEYL